MRNLFYIFLLFNCSFIFVSCDKAFIRVEGYEAEIQGKWQLTPADTVFYNFQNSLFQYQIYLNKDSVLSMNGYYTLYGDTAIYLELTPAYTYINALSYFGPTLYNIGWDSVSPGTLARYYKLEGPENNRLKLTHPEEGLIFQKF